MAQNMLRFTKEQPVVWKSIVDQRKALCADFVKANLGKNVKRVVMLGSGSSNNASVMAQEFFQKLLGIEVLAVAPTRLGAMRKLLDAETTLCWAVSQSGKSTSTIAVIDELHADGFSVTAVTANPESPIAKQCDSHVLIACGEETVGPKTKGMTATALTLFLMGMELTLAQGKLAQSDYDQTIADLYQSFTLADANIEASIAWSRKNKDLIAKAPHFIIVAEGMNYSVSLEAALKLLETLYIPVFPYEFEEYLHGVGNTIDANSYMFYLVSNSYNRERMLRLNEYSAAHGSNNLLITHGAPTGIENELYLQTSGNDFTLPFETLLPFHVISALNSEDKGIDCDHPKFKDFSIMGTKA